MNLEDWGLNVVRLSAGFSGGVLHALLRKNIAPAAVVASVVAGTLTANYLGAAAGHYVPVWVGNGARLTAARISSSPGDADKKE